MRSTGKPHVHRTLVTLPRGRKAHRWHYDCKPCEWISYWLDDQRTAFNTATTHAQSLAHHRAYREFLRDPRNRP